MAIFLVKPGSLFQEVASALQKDLSPYTFVFMFIAKSSSNFLVYLCMTTSDPLVSASCINEAKENGVMFCLAISDQRCLLHGNICDVSTFYSVLKCQDKTEPYLNVVPVGTCVCADKSGR